MRTYSLYTGKSITDLWDRLEQKGYEIITISEGVCGWGHTVFLSPSENLYSFEIKEVPLNCWESAHEVRRFVKMSARLRAEIEQAEQE